MDSRAKIALGVAAAAAVAFLVMKPRKKQTARPKPTVTAPVAGSKVSKDPPVESKKAPPAPPAPQPVESPKKVEVASPPAVASPVESPKAPTSPPPTQSAPDSTPASPQQPDPVPEPEPEPEPAVESPKTVEKPEPVAEAEPEAPAEHPVYGKGRFAVTSTKDVKLDAVRSVFGADVSSLLGMSSNSNSAEQPIDSDDCLSGAVGAFHRIQYLLHEAPEGTFDKKDYDVVVSIENSIHADKLLETAHVVIYNINKDQYQVGSCSIPVHSIEKYLDQSELETPLEHDRRTSGYHVTVGKLIAREHPDIPHTDWVAQFSKEGVSRGVQITRAIKAAQEAAYIDVSEVPSSHRSTPLGRRPANESSPQPPSSPPPAAVQSAPSPAVSPLAATSPPGSLLTSPTAETSPVSSPVSVKSPSGSLLTGGSAKPAPVVSTPEAASEPASLPTITSPVSTKSARSGRSRRSARSPRTPKSPAVTSPQAASTPTVTSPVATSTTATPSGSAVQSPKSPTPAAAADASTEAPPAAAGEGGQAQEAPARPSGAKKRNRKRNRKKGSGRGGQ